MEKMTARTRAKSPEYRCCIAGKATVMDTRNNYSSV